MWDFIVMLLVNLIIYYVGVYMGRRSVKKHEEFSWDCLGEGCEFHVCSTNADLTLQLADVHMESKHPQGY